MIRNGESPDYELKNEWWFSIIDVVDVLTGNDRPRKYWNDLKKKLISEGYFEVSEKEYSHHPVIIPVSGLQKAVLNAVKYGKALSDDVAAVYVSLDPAETAKVQAKWKNYGMGAPLVIMHSPYRSVIEPLMDYINGIRERYEDGVITVVLPEFVPQKWWHHLLHNQTALFIKGIILFKKGVVSTSVPLHLK